MLHFILTDNGPKLSPRFYKTFCGFVKEKHMTTTACHPETKGQLESDTKTIVARLRHYVVEPQNSWDILVQPLLYAYNSQVRRSIEVSPFGLVLKRHTRGAATFDFLSPLPSDLFDNISPAYGVAANCRKSGPHERIL